MRGVQRQRLRALALGRPRKSDDGSLHGVLGPGRCALRQHSCNTLYTGCSDSVVPTMRLELKEQRVRCLSCIFSAFHFDLEDDQI